MGFSKTDKRGTNVGILIFAVLDPIGFAFHAIVVFNLGYVFLFKSILGHCALLFSFWCHFWFPFFPFFTKIHKKGTKPL